jgi:hypothetical protein
LELDLESLASLFPFPFPFPFPCPRPRLLCLAWIFFLSFFFFRSKKKRIARKRNDCSNACVDLLLRRLLGRLRPGP